MSYIIVWRNSHRDPHLDVDDRNFLETYSSYEQAKEAADNIFNNENEGTEKSPWYFDYEIYEHRTY